MRGAGPRVRWRREDELSAVREVNHRAFAAYEGIFSPQEIEGLFSGELPQSGSWLEDRERPLGVLVAELGSSVGSVVGMAGLARLKGGDGELTALYVLPEHKGRGVGSALWAAALDELRGLGLSGMRVWALAGVPAAGFYERRGCRRIGGGTYGIGDHAEETLGYRLDL